MQQQYTDIGEFANVGIFAARSNTFPSMLVRFRLPMDEKLTSFSHD